MTLASHGPNRKREATLRERRERLREHRATESDEKGKPGFTERWRERRASETAEHD